MAPGLMLHSFTKSPTLLPSAPSSCHIHLSRDLVPASIPHLICHSHSRSCHSGLPFGPQSRPRCGPLTFSCLRTLAGNPGSLLGMMSFPGLFTQQPPHPHPAILEFPAPSLLQAVLRSVLPCRKQTVLRQEGWPAIPLPTVDPVTALAQGRPCWQAGWMSG
jgi:hypothetical protein